MSRPTRHRTHSIRFRPSVLTAAAVLALTACGTDPSAPPPLPLSLGGGSAESSVVQGAPAMDARFAAPVIFVAGDGLPDLGGDRTAYRLGAGSDDALRRVADALGITGDVATDAGGRRIVDGAATIESYDGARWSFYDAEGVSTGIAIACDPDGRCEEPPPPERPGDLPTETEARDLALAVLGTAGPEIDDALVSVEDGITNWYVDVQYVIDGMIVDGLTSSASVGAGGRIEWASGLLSDVETVGDYATIGTEGGIDRLNEGWGMAFTMGVAVGADPALGAPEPVPGDEVVVDDPMPPVEEVDPPEPVEVTITDVEWTLTVLSSWDSSGVYVIPAYRFTAGDGSAPITPAVADDVIAPPTPADEGQSGDGSDPGAPVRPEPLPEPAVAPDPDAAG